jgi:hypothetical protein
VGVLVCVVGVLVCVFWSVFLHTAVFPGGELRADLAEVPVFASGFQAP